MNEDLGGLDDMDDMDKMYGRTGQTRTPVEYDRDTGGGGR